MTQTGSFHNYLILTRSWLNLSYDILLRQEVVWKEVLELIFTIYYPQKPWRIIFSTPIHYLYPSLENCRVLNINLKYDLPAFLCINFCKWGLNLKKSLQTFISLPLWVRFIPSLLRLYSPRKDDSGTLSLFVIKNREAVYWVGICIIEWCLGNKGVYYVEGCL